MEFPLCARFGLPADEIERRLMMFGIGLEDARHLSVARDIIAAGADELVDVFYRHLFAFPELARFLSQKEVSLRLRTQLRRYLLTLGVDVHKPEYIEGRLRIGAVHDRVGIPLKGYLGAYACLQNSINELIHNELRHNKAASFVACSINKVIMLDAALAVETYHVASIDRSEHLITQLERDQEQIRRLSQTDHLTGVMNRRCFLDCLEAEIQRCQRYGNSLCVLMIDVDNFKSVNDTFGHHAGDAVLKAIGRTLTAVSRMTDRCGRWGGEEFVMALVETDVATAEVMAERIRLAILHEEISVDEWCLMVGVSIGIAGWSPDMIEATAVLNKADVATYAAKAAGKNCVRVADQEEPVQVNGDS